MIAKWRSASAVQRFNRELTRAGALIPTRQAEAFKEAHLDHPVLQQHPHLRMWIWLAWKTASRWDDLECLTRDRVFLPEDNPNEIVIDWFTETKTSAMRPFKASRYVVITGRRTAELRQWMEGGWTGRCPPWSVAARFLKMIDPAYTPHSLKVGALTHLHLQGRGESWVPLCRLAKHQIEDIPETSLRYLRFSVALARTLETQLATALL